MRKKTRRYRANPVRRVRARDFATGGDDGDGEEEGETTQRDENDYDNPAAADRLHLLARIRGNGVIAASREWT